MRYHILLYIALIMPFFCAGQYNIGTTYSNHNDLNASKYQPAALDLNDKTFQIGFNYYLWMGNSAFNYKNIKKAYDEDNIDFLSVGVQKNNLLGAGQEYQLLGLAYQFKLLKDKRLVLGFSVVDKFAFIFKYTDQFLKLALRGNKQFAGQTVLLGATTFNANYSREYVVSTALPLFGDDATGLRLGIRAKYIQGLASMYMPKGNASLFTEQNGRYLEMNFDYSIQTAGLNEFSLLKSKGSGFGLDAGLTLNLGGKFELSASILDIGGIGYSKNTRGYAKTGSGRYEGLVIDNLFGGTRVNLDSANAIIDANQSAGQKFTMPLGTRVCAQLEYKFSKEGEEEGRSSSLFVTYIQGINDYPGTVKRPFVSIGYNHNFHKVFDAGVMAAAGGYNKVAAGAFTSLRLFNTIKLGLSSDNLMAFIVPSYGTGIDVAVNLSIAF